MNILEKIKRLFKNKEIKNISREIAPIDVSDVYVPEYDELNQEEKEKVLEYQREIDIENLETLIAYNKEIVAYGEKISKLLIKFLYELQEITRKDNKTEEELNEEYVDIAIKNIKLIILKDSLKSLLDESVLKTVAILEIDKKDKKRKYEFLGIFSKASKIKRNMQQRILEQAVIWSKLTIKTLNLQYQAILNSTSSNDNLLNKFYIYNTLKSKVNFKFERKEVYLEKLKYFFKANSLLTLNQLDNLKKIEELLNDFKEEREAEIIFRLTKTEVEIDKYVYDNKDKLILIFKEELEKLKNTNISLNLKEKLLEKIDNLETMSIVLKEFISDLDLKDLYRIKFNMLTIDINTLNDYPIKKTNKKEFDCYKEIVNELINGIINGEAKGVEIFKSNDDFKKLIKILNSEFKTNRYYDYEKILNDKYLLALLLAFSKEDGLEDFYNNYKFNHSLCHDYAELYENNDFDWDSSLSIDTICQLIDSEVKYNGRKEVPPFYELYLLKRKYFYDDSTYKLPEGLISVGDSYNISTALGRQVLFKQLYEEASLSKYFIDNSKGKNVILPSTFKRINISLFCDNKININSLFLNDGLETIANNVFYNQIIKNISIPSSLWKIGDNTFNFLEVEILEFRDFKNSILLKDLLYSDKKWSDEVMRNLFRGKSLEKINLYDENNNLYQIDLRQLEIDIDPKSLKSSKGNDKVTYILNQFRKCLIEEVEKKTGYLIKSIDDASKTKLIK